LGIPAGQLETAPDEVSVGPVWRTFTLKQITLFRGADMSTTLLRVLLAFSVLTTAALKAQVGALGDAVVAEVSGHNLTADDLQQKESGKLLQARYQYYMTQRKALEELIDDQLLANAAQAQGLTVDQLFEKEVYKQVKDPTEEQLRVTYEVIDTKESYEAVRTQVLEHIRETRRNTAKAAYIDGLRKKANITVFLMPPVTSVDIAGADVRGSRDAEVMVVEFADYECPYCEKVNPYMQQLRKEYGDKVAIVFKDFPLPMHHKAQKAAEAARCAGEQGKFWEYHDVLFNSGGALGVPQLKEHARVLKLNGEQFDQCLDNGEMAAVVNKDLEEGKRLGLTGTPSFFVNGHFFSGAVEYGLVKQMVEQQLAVNAKSGSKPLAAKR
jgi:protein-disulfide isomerase